MTRSNQFATTLSFLFIFALVQPASARRLNQLDVATIAGSLDPGKMEYVGGAHRIFIDKTGKPSLQPRDLTGGRFVLVVPHRSGQKSIVVHGVQGKTGAAKDQVTQTDYLLPRGAVRPRFVRALTTNRTVSPEGFTISRAITPGMFGTQRSSMTVFRFNGRPNTGSKKTSRWGQKVPSMRSISRQAASFVQKPFGRRR